MNDALARSTWPACLSALQLDRWLLGELAAAEAAEVRVQFADLQHLFEGAGALGAMDVVERHGLVPH